jgi:trehalose synthase
VSSLLSRYGAVAGHDVVHHLQQLSERLRGRPIVHVNSTREGGGVAEILAKLVPLMQELGLETHWEVISGPEEFYQCTKSMHNALQGNPVDIGPDLLEAYHEANRAFAREHQDLLSSAGVVLIHDPQPAALRSLVPHREGVWIWRCHIDLSRPHPPVWDFLSQYVDDYDASIFSLKDFAKTLPHTQYLITPSIDPLADKNRDLEDSEVDRVRRRHGLEPGRPLMVQVSRYDHFKDPLGVIRAYRLARRYVPDLQLVLAGGSAADDPEGAEVLAEVRAEAGNDPDCHVLELPPDAHTEINALQRAADVVVQKSLKEGFGLTVTEGLWKGRPVVGGNTGGIRLQVIPGHTGYLVDTPEGAALRVRYLVENPEVSRQMGAKARELVRENFLITRQLREYLTVMVVLAYGCQDQRLTLD